ncbi:hypothetical protein Trydic_g4732 [Trypoxylus dichotomus]
MDGASWEADPEVKAELQAMAGFSSLPEPKASDTPKLRKSKKRKSKIISKKPTKSKEKTTTSLTSYVDQIELLNVIKQPAFTLEDKYKILEARDKLIRLRTKKTTDIATAKHIVGTCPDMCPEKERLMREIQHQISLYEQEPSEKTMSPFLAVKQYSRSSADQEVPLPHELRPVTVLKQTMSYLLHKIANICDNPDTNLAEWYHFLWDRTRGIRKDITQQELCCKGSVELVEQCARFHIHCSARLVAEDASVFDQKINTENLTKCLQTLKYMYHDLQLKNESCSNEPEFRAYVILLNLNDANFMWEVQQLQKEIQKSKEVQFALKVYSALDKNNYVRFFNLVKSTSYLNACLLLRYFVQVRLTALKTIIKSHSPRMPHTQFPLEELRRILAFEGNASTIDFLEYYNLQLNERKTHVILDRKSFIMPKFPYSLDRAMNVIESKRVGSVGEVICGRPLDEIDFLQYTPHDSFNSDGLLDVGEYLPDIDLIALQKEKDLVEKMSKDDIDDKPSESFSKGSHSSMLHPNVFVIKSSSESRSNSPFDTVDKGPDTKAESAPFWGKAEKDIGSSIFGSGPDNSNQSASIFGGVSTQEKPATALVGFPIKTGNSSVFPNAPQTGSIFAQPLKQSDIQQQPTKPLLGYNRPSVFTQKPSETSKGLFQPIRSIPHTTTPPSKFPSAFSGHPNTSSQADKRPGGFSFNLEMKTTPSTGVTTSNMTPPVLRMWQARPGHENENQLKKQKEEASRLQKELEEKIRLENEKRKQLQEIKLAAQKREIERQRVEKETARMEEAARRRKMEEMEKKRLEEERLRVLRQRELAKQRQLEETRKRLKLEEEKKRLKMEEERRRLEMERKKRLEERAAVKRVMDDLMVKVEEKVRNDKLKSISHRMRMKKAAFCFTRWRNAVIVNKRKRKAIDQWPIWVNWTTLEEEATQLRIKNQDETLKYMKRYKSGIPMEIDVSHELTIDKIDLERLTCHLLLRNFRGSPIGPRENFLKIDIYLASLSYMTTNLKWIEKVLNKLFDWKDNYELTSKSELLSNTIHYCIRRKLSFKNEATDGYIFIADEFSEGFYEDIKKIVESLKKHSNVPIVIVLQDDDFDKDNLDNLVSNGNISQYKIMNGRYTPKNIVSYIENSLLYLAENAPKSPPLELDTLKSFLYQYLATEVWKRMTSFTKWNKPYRICLTNPEIVINLYNQALSMLESMIFDKDSLEYPDFPEIFQEYIPQEPVPILPCDFKHFPSFWKNDSYRGKIKRIFADLTLPKFETNWPPKDMKELETMISEFCVKFFRDPFKKMYKIIASILNCFDPLENFSDIQNVLWSKVIEVVILEKLEEIDFSLREPFTCVFDELFVVYNRDCLLGYRTSTWFYLDNHVIRKVLDLNEGTFDEMEGEDVMKESEDVFEISNEELETSLLEVAQERCDREEKLNNSKKDLREFEMLMADLEQSMNIQKQISKRFEDILSRALHD